ncbi:hypothetical protein [Streptomyces sp. EMB24]|uniref:hypothetical protein n=1 Tax=Streptomyces sp. EMB24 TaxID=2835531 RepID=UPI00227A4144|nr:hypothetical protein [Streptomyces sp. EMB24]
MPVSTVPATRPPRQVVRIPRPGGSPPPPRRPRTGGPGRAALDGRPWTGGPGRAALDGRPWTPEPPYRPTENRHRGEVLGVDGMSTADSAQVVQSTGNGTEDHEWRFV